MSPEDPLADARRLAELRALAVLDTPPEREFDDLAAMAAVVTRSRVAAVNFVDGQRHYTKAIVGMPEAEGSSVANDVSFCAATLRESSGMLVVSDTHEDDRWRDHELVTGGPRVGFYMGAAIVLDGHALGVVCAFGSESRRITNDDRTALRNLAGQAAAQLRLRRTGRPATG